MGIGGVHFLPQLKIWRYRPCFLSFALSVAQIAGARHSTGQEGTALRNCCYIIFS